MWFCRNCGIAFEEPVYEQDVLDGWQSVELCTCPYCEDDEIEEVTEEEAFLKMEETREYLKEEGEPFKCVSCGSAGYYIPTYVRHAKFSKAICLECGTINYIKKGE